MGFGARKKAGRTKTRISVLAAPKGDDEAVLNRRIFPPVFV